MKIGIVVAMEEEFLALNDFFKGTLENNSFYKIYSTKYKSLEVFAIISKIGKVASSSATTHLINHYNPDFLINLGSCGGVNSANIASIILSCSAGYHDVDVQAFGYKFGQLPQQPEFFKTKENIVNHQTLFDNIIKTHKILNGFIITGDSFVADKTKVNFIKNIYPNTLGVEMEAAAFAQVCNLYNKDFLLIKKVSDMADSEASQSFKEEITKMSESTTNIVQSVLNYLSEL